MLKSLFYTENLFPILLINIFIYLFTLFLFFTVFNTVSNNKLKYLNFLSTLSIFVPTKFFLIISFFSLCGIPPLAGFFAKLYILISLFNKSTYFLVYLFFFFNLFAMFFYLQNMRFLINNSKIKVFQTSNMSYKVNTSSQSILTIFIFIIVFAYIYISCLFFLFTSLII